MTTTTKGTTTASLAPRRCSSTQRRITTEDSYKVKKHIFQTPLGHRWCCCCCLFSAWIGRSLLVLEARLTDDSDYGYGESEMANEDDLIDKFITLMMILGDPRVALLLANRLLGSDGDDSWWDLRTHTQPDDPIVLLAGDNSLIIDLVILLLLLP